MGDGSGDGSSSNNNNNNKPTQIVFRLSNLFQGMFCSTKAIPLIDAPVIISVIPQGIYFYPQSFWT